MRVSRKNGCIIGQFSSEVYPANYEVFIGDMDKGTDLYVAQYPDLKESFAETSFWSAKGLYFHDFERNIGAIFLESKYDHYTLAHECLHAVNHLFINIQAASISHGNEPEAYYLCWLMHKCDEINKIGKAKKGAK